MGFRLKVEGPETIDLGLENILTVEFNTDTPNDSNSNTGGTVDILLITILRAW